MSVYVYHVGFRNKTKRSISQVYNPIHVYHVQEPVVLYNDGVVSFTPTPLHLFKLCLVVVQFGPCCQVWRVGPLD